MNEDAFCEAFCQRLALREVPIGRVLKTPFRRPDGDPIDVYMRRADDGTYRLEDDGQTIGFIEAGGVDLESDTRFEALTELLREYDAFWDENESLLHTDYLLEERLPPAAIKFSALLLRIYDLLLLTTSRVRSTFRDDLIDMVRRQFGPQAAIELNAPVQESMKDYLVDIIVRAPDGRSLAIFAATSELKALEAILFWKEYRDQDIRNMRAMLVLETAKPRDIKERTVTRVMNSGLILAAMDGEEIQIGRKMKESLL